MKKSLLTIYKIKNKKKTFLFVVVVVYSFVATERRLTTQTTVLNALCHRQPAEAAMQHTVTASPRLATPKPQAVEDTNNTATARCTEAH